MVGKHRVEGVDFGSPNCPESIFTPGQFFGSFDALGSSRSPKLSQMLVLLTPKTKKKKKKKKQKNKKKIFCSKIPVLPINFSGLWGCHPTLHVTLPPTGDDASLHGRHSSNRCSGFAELGIYGARKEGR